MLQVNFLSLCLIILISVTNMLCENSASVCQVIPRNNEQLYLLRQLDGKLKNILYWTDPTGVNKTVDVMVPEDQVAKFKHLMTKNNVTFEVKVPNVQTLLNNSVKSQRHSNIEWLYSTHSQSINRFSFKKFHTLDEIYNWIDNLATLYPNNLSVVTAGYSGQNRSIKGVHLKFSTGKKGIFIEAGIHAREWISHATATYLINELLTSTKPEIRSLAESYEWYIFPCVNPDGYVFTHINPNHINYRMWRKTRSKQIVQKCTDFLCRNYYCYGADPNRNWDVYWEDNGKSDSPCSESYKGTSAFSEIEVKSLSRYISTVASNLFAYISFHSYGEKLLFPYGFTKERINNYNEQYYVGLQAVNALSRKYGTQYELGTIADIIGDVSGSAMDYVKAIYHVPFAFTYELRSQTSKNKFYGFIAPPSEIIPNGEEIVDSLVGLFNSVTRK